MENKNIPFNVYSKNGVRIVARNVQGGYQLLKYDITLPLEFAPSCKLVTVKTEYLRNGRIFLTRDAMYKYLIKYRRHTLRDFSGVKRPNNHKEKIPTSFDRKRNREVFAYRTEVFGRWM